MRQMHPYTFLKQLLASLVLLLPFSPAHAAGRPAPTRTTLTASGPTLSAAVRTATGEPVTAGTVDFLLPSGESLGSAIVGADGAATLALGKLPPGSGTSVAGDPTLPVTAVYQSSTENSVFAGSASPTAAVTSEAATTVLPDFTLTGNPTTVTAKQGAYGTTAITVTAVGGYTGAIQLSCTGLPAQVTCAFNPTQQTLGATGAFTTTLQLETQGPSGTASSSLLPLHPRATLALVFPGALLLLGFARRRRALGHTALLGAALLLVTGVGLTGCSQRYGYLHHPAPVAGGTPRGTFPITVVVDGAQGSSVLEHDLAISLVVQ